MITTCGYESGRYVGHSGQQTANDCGQFPPVTVGELIGEKCGDDVEGRVDAQHNEWTVGHIGRVYVASRVTDVLKSPLESLQSISAYHGMSGQYHRMFVRTNILSNRL